MPKGFPKSDDPSESLDQLAEIAHREEFDELLGRFPYGDTLEGRQLVGKLFWAVRGTRRPKNHHPESRSAE